MDYEAFKKNIHIQPVLYDILSRHKNGDQVDERETVNSTTWDEYLTSSVLTHNNDEQKQQEYLQIYEEL